MKRKIELDYTESRAIFFALSQSNMPNMPNIARVISSRWDAADPANDGPEVDILRARVVTCKHTSGFGSPITPEGVCLLCRETGLPYPYDQSNE